MWMKKTFQFALLAVAALAVVAEPPSPYASAAYTTGFRPGGHVGYQGGYQTGYQGGFHHGGYQTGYHGGYQGGYRAKYQGGYDEGVPTPFSFQYEVKDPQTGNDYGHQASSDGRAVQGEYHVLLPDGRRQIVKYTADDNGYNADVRYEGQAKQYQGFGGYSGHGGYTGHSGYTGHGGYTGHAGYTGHSGYTGQGAFVGFAGQKAGFGGYTGQKAVYSAYAR